MLHALNVIKVSVMITTRNRADDLRRTCRVINGLDPKPTEIIITADGCSDNTIEVIQSELPHARIIVNPTGLGSVASRDRMMREAIGDVVLSLDDDSYPEQPDVIERIKALFLGNPKLAVAHFPQRTDEYPATLTQKDFGPPRCTRSFASSGAVLRRAAYLQLPGFVKPFFHMYEEPDYVLQCVAAGFEIWFIPGITIRHHYTGAMRSELRNHHRHARNQLWSMLMRCPFPQLLVVVPYRTLNQFTYAWARGLTWVIREPNWWFQALAGMPYCLKNRRPVPWSKYLGWLKMDPT